MLASVMDNRNLGYWHIGQAYNKQGKFAAETVPTDDMEMTKGQLLQVNFAPVWHAKGARQGGNDHEAYCDDRSSVVRESSESSSTPRHVVRVFVETPH